MNEGKLYLPPQIVARNFSMSDSEDDQLSGISSKGGPPMQI